MIAAPHLAFLAVLYVAGLLVWLFDVGSLDTPTAVAGAVVAGLGAGLFLGAVA